MVIVVVIAMVTGVVIVLVVVKWMLLGSRLRRSRSVGHAVGGMVHQ